MISKPVVPPWDDSAKNIVRDQVSKGGRYAYHVLTARGVAPPAPGVICEPIYGDGGTYAAGLRQNLRVFTRALRPRGASLYHYFFAPNPLTSRMGRLLRLTSRVPSVQTICSAPASFERAAGLLFTDVAIVLSADTLRRFVAAGVPESKLRLIRPGIPALAPLAPERKREVREGHGLGPGPLVIFPGDYEFSDAARTVEAAVPLLAAGRPDVTVVFACRIKREASRAIEQGIRERLEAAGHGARVRFFPKVADMPSLAGAADVVVMPAESLYAKMDAPLVLLEAMSQGVPLVLADVPPLDEILAMGAGLGVRPGDPSGLTEAMLRLLGDEACRAETGAAGSRAVRAHFSAGSMAAAVEAIYDELLGG